MFHYLYGPSFRNSEHAKSKVFVGYLVPEAEHGPVSLEHGQALI